MSDPAPEGEAPLSDARDETGWVALPETPAAEGTPGFVPGAVIGRYEIISLIATGGMAAVFLARVVGTSAPLLAIKRIHPHLARDDNFAKMFIDEARIAMRLHHRNVVPTHAIEDLDAPCIVMDYVDGDQLRRFMQSPQTADGRIPPAVATRIAADMLRGLHAAHELQDDDGALMEVVHRDVSPQNVLVGRDGVTRVTDFGIARARGRLAVTRQGLVRGKLRYMAPEQATPRETPPDRRADIFAAGIIVWEIVTGRRLFRGDEATVVQKLLHLPIPRPREMRAGIDESLDIAVMGALEREMDVRYATAAEFADALESAARKSVGVATDAEVADFVARVLGPSADVPGISLDADAGPGTDVEVMLSAGTLLRAGEGPSPKTSWPAPPVRPAPEIQLPSPDAVLSVSPQEPLKGDLPAGDKALVRPADDAAILRTFLRPAIPAWAVGLIAVGIAAAVAFAVRMLLR